MTNTLNGSTGRPIWDRKFVGSSSEVVVVAIYSVSYRSRKRATGHRDDITAQWLVKKTDEFHDHDRRSEWQSHRLTATPRNNLIPRHQRIAASRLKPSDRWPSKSEKAQRTVFRSPISDDGALNYMITEMLTNRKTNVV